MEKKQTINKKFKLALVSMCCAFVLATGALIGVLAASSQSLGASFSISYFIAENIAVKSNSTYQLAGGEVVELDEIRFNVDDEPTPTTISIPDIELSVEQNYFELGYSFQTLSPENDIVLKVYWDNLLDNIYNIKITMTYTFLGEDPVVIYDNKNPLTDPDPLPFGDENGFPIATRDNRDWSTFKIDLRFEVDDLNKSAYVRSTEDGGLTFTFTYAELSLD